MPYLFEDHEFNDITEYMAAKRDRAKINALEKKGSSKARIAKNMKAQIAREGICFETVVGKEFLKQLDIDSFTYTEDDPDPLREMRLKNNAIKRKRRAANILLIPFYIILMISIGAGILWMKKEKEAQESMARLQQRAAVSPTPVPTKAAAVLDGVADAQDKQEIEAETIKDEPAGATPAADLRPKEILPRFKELYEENKDLAGWLTIEGTVIDYPVMYKDDDNDFYLSHDFEGNSDVNGLLVLDKRCDREGDGINMLIHGHHMRNGTMFGNLGAYEDRAYCREHPVIKYSTLYEEREYEVFAVFKSSVYDEDTTDLQFYDFIEITTIEQFNTYIRSALDDSLYDTGVRPYWGDKLISLSTCEYSKENGRLVVVGREVK